MDKTQGRIDFYLLKVFGFLLPQGTYNLETSPCLRNPVGLTVVGLIWEIFNIGNAREAISPEGQIAWLCWQAEAWHPRGQSLSQIGILLLPTCLHPAWVLWNVERSRPIYIIVDSDSPEMADRIRWPNYQVNRADFCVWKTLGAPFPQSASMLPRAGNKPNRESLFHPLTAMERLTDISQGRLGG